MANGCFKYSMLMFSAYINVEIGALLGIIGPTLPDLQVLFKSSLQEISSLFLPLGLSLSIGAVLSSIFLRKCNFNLLMSTTLLIYSISTASIAATRMIYVAFTVIFIAGFSVSLLGNAVYFLSHMLFPTQAYVFHILASSMSLGSVLGPLIAEPFLGTTSSCNSTLNTTDEVPLFKLPGVQRLGKYNQSYNDHAVCDAPSSVEYLYIGLGASCIPTSIACCIVFVKFRCIDTYTTLEPDESYNPIEMKSGLSRIIFILLLILIFPSVYGLAFAYASYLTTITAIGRRQLSLQMAALLTMVFWINFLIGRVLAAVLSIYCRQIILIYICLLGSIIAFVELILTAELSEIYLWIGTSALAAFLGPLFASVLAWSRGCITFTPLILGLCTFADNVGATLLPFVAGQIISLHGTKFHLYYCLSLSIFQCLLFCIVHALGWAKTPSTVQL